MCLSIKKCVWYKGKKTIKVSYFTGSTSNIVSHLSSSKLALMFMFYFKSISYLRNENIFEAIKVREVHIV